MRAFIGFIVSTVLSISVLNGSVTGDCGCLVYGETEGADFYPTASSFTKVCQEAETYCLSCYPYGSNTTITCIPMNSLSDPSPTYQTIVGAVNAARNSSPPRIANIEIARSEKRNKNITQAEPIPPIGQVTHLAHEQDHNAIWTRGFYQSVKNPTGHLDSWGAVLGYDYFYSMGLISGAVEFARSKPHEYDRLGYIDSGLAIIHGAVQLPSHFYTEYGVVGSVNFHNIDRASYKSYGLDPNISFGYDYDLAKWLIVEPFVCTDFVFIFQESFKTKNLSLKYDELNVGVFRLEPGLGFYEHWTRNWGTLILREKFAYVYKKPMFGTVAYVRQDGPFESFAIDTRVVEQNLFSFNFEFFVRSVGGVFTSASYRGEWGSGQSLNEGRLRIGYYF